MSKLWVAPVFLIQAACFLPGAPVPSRGTYLGHTWEIGADRLIRWDGKPYVRFGFTGNGPLRRMLELRFTQFNVTPAEEWAICADPEERSGIVPSVDEYTDRLVRAGATYYAGINVLWPWAYGDRIKTDDQKVRAVLRQVMDLPADAGSRPRTFTVGFPLHPAEWKDLKIEKKLLLLFNLKAGTATDVTSKIEEFVPLRTSTEGVDEGDSRPWRLRLSPLRQRGDRLMLLVEVLLKEVPGVWSSFPALWKKPILKEYVSGLKAFRKAFAKDGLRGLMFADEINTFPQSLLSARSYLDFRTDKAALREYRTFLKRRFGSVEKLNESFGTSYKTFAEVPWLIPLHPFTGEDFELYGSEKLDRLCIKLHRSGAVSFVSLRHLKAAAGVQEDFRLWFLGRWLGEYAKLAKKVIGNVPVFLCSASVDGPAWRYLGIHRSALQQGVDGLIRNCYGRVRRVGGRPEIVQPGGERYPLETVCAFLKEIEAECGKTKHLFANEFGYLNEYGDDLPDDFGLGGRYRFPSRTALRDFLHAMVDYGYKGMNLFAMQPLHPARRSEVKWLAGLREEIVKRIIEGEACARLKP